MPLLSGENLVIGGITYYGVNNNFSSLVLGNGSVEASTGVPTDAFVSASMAYILYGFAMKTGTGSLWGNIYQAAPVGLGAAVGSLLGTAVGFANGSAIGAAIGAVYANDTMQANKANSSVTMAY